MDAPAVMRSEETPFWSALFTDRRIAPALGLGFTSGIPVLLVYATQSAWLSDIERAHGKAEIINGKQRHGPNGTAELKFDAEDTRFSTIASEEDLPERM